MACSFGLSLIFMDYDYTRGGNGAKRGRRGCGNLPARCCHRPPSIDGAHPSLFAALAEKERLMIATRTEAALAAANGRGVTRLTGFTNVTVGHYEAAASRLLIVRSQTRNATTT
jgi:hypothetical protein